jgi:hypothetical protein
MHHSPRPHSYAVPVHCARPSHVNSMTGAPNPVSPKVTVQMSPMQVPSVQPMAVHSPQVGMHRSPPEAPVELVLQAAMMP